MIAARQVMPLRPLALIAALGAIAIALPPAAIVALAIVALVAWLAFARTTVALRFEQFQMLTLTQPIQRTYAPKTDPHADLLNAPTSL